MTVPISVANVSTRTVTAPGSRYRGQTVIYWGPLNLLTFDTYVRRPYTPRGDEKVMVITKGVEYRPDLVSQEFYGFPDNWWRILEANGMLDVWDFKAGKTITLPNMGL